MSITTFLRILVRSIIGFITTLLLLRFILLLVGANSAVWFTQFIYALTDPLMAPFAGITPTLYEQGSVFDFSIIVAMVVYGLLGLGVQWLFDLVDQAAQVRTLTDKRTTY